MVNRLGVIIVDGRQYVPPVSCSSQTIQQNQQMPLPSYSLPQQVNIGTNVNPLFVVPPAYSQNSNIVNNLMRTSGVQLPVQNVRAGNIRPQFSNMNMHYNGTVIFMNNVQLVVNFEKLHVYILRYICSL